MSDNYIVCALCGKNIWLPGLYAEVTVAHDERGHHVVTFVHESKVKK